MRIDFAPTPDTNAAVLLPGCTPRTKFMELHSGSEEKILGNPLMSKKIDIQNNILYIELEHETYQPGNIEYFLLKKFSHA